jgi:nucleoside diphosphate kinase
LTGDRDDTAKDIYFYESHEDVVEVLGAEAPAWLHRTALLVFFPDAVVSNQVGAGVRLLGGLGFVPLAAELVRIDGKACREIYRRELRVLNDETRDRLAIHDAFMPFTDSIVVLLADERPEEGVAASRRFRPHKGSGEPHLRRPGTVRAVLNSPNNVFRLVHSSDGPTEMVRDLGILLDGPQRRRLLRDLRRGRPMTAEDLEKMAAHSRARVGERSLDVQPPLQAMREQLAARTRNGGGGPELAAFAAMLTDLAEGRPVHCDDLYRAARRTGGRLDSWELIAIGALAMSSVRPATSEPAGPR